MRGGLGGGFLGRGGCDFETVSLTRFKRQSFIIISMIVVLMVCFSTLPFYTVRKSKTVPDFWDFKDYCPKENGKWLYS